MRCLEGGWLKSVTDAVSRNGPVKKRDVTDAVPRRAWCHVTDAVPRRRLVKKRYVTDVVPRRAWLKSVTLLTQCLEGA